MKRILALALLASCVAMAVPSTASAWHGGGWHGGWHGGLGWRGGWGWGPRFYGVYPGYAYYGGCWRWVPYPYWHRAWVCY